MARPTRYSPEVRERAVRLVREHGPEHPSQWAAIAAIAPKLGCTSETLRRWVRQAERDTGHRAGLTTDERQRLNHSHSERSYVSTRMIDYRRSVRSPKIDRSP